MDSTGNIIKALTLLLDLKSLSLVLLQALSKDVHENCTDHLESLMNTAAHPVIVRHSSHVDKEGDKGLPASGTLDDILLYRKPASEVPVVKMNVGSDDHDDSQDKDSHPFSLIRKLIAIATKVS